MHISWVSIVLCLIVFIVGPIICVRFSKDKTQKRAVLIAFAVLFVVWLVFFVVVEVFLQYSIMPVLAAASLIVPIAVYFAIVRTKSTKLPNTQKTDVKQPIAKTVTWEEVIEQQEKRRDMPYKTTDEGSESTKQEATEIADLTPEGEYPLRPDAQVKDDVRAQKTSQEVEEEFSKLKQTITSEKPVVVDEKARTGELTKISVDEIKPVEQKDASLAVTPELEIAQEAVTDTVPDDVPDETEVAVVSQPEEPTKSEQGATKVSFEALQQKADACAKRDIWPLAAKLYEQSSQLAGNDDDKQGALFSAMSAYLKAKKLDEVTRLVDHLDAGGGLTPAQTLKLSAIKKMLL